MRDLRKYLLTSTAILSLGGVAEAAPPMPYMNAWSGPYVGANVGVARSDATCSPAQYPYYSCGSYYQGSTPTGLGFVGGVQAGYDWQEENFVYGVVGDFDGAVLRTSQSGYYSESTTHADWLSSFRGRLGFAFGRTLVYGTGGLALGEFRTQDTYAGYNYGSLNRVLVGWVMGGGIERKMTPNWSLFAEALYYDFQNAGSSITHPISSSYAYQSNFHFDEMTVRIGSNWHF